jgi:3',5'-cyclic-AMP phosphodiesterase
LIPTRSVHFRLLPLVGALLAVGSAPAHADNAELITVTTNSAVATWVTSSPADTTVCWGRQSSSENCRTQETATLRHYAVMDRLAPGTGYVYELRSAGSAEPPTLPSPGSFTTLTPPGGRHLFDFALLNDTHVGEGCAGTAFNDPLLGSSVPPCFSAPDYAGRMDAAMVQEIAGRRTPLTVINGDVTAEARPTELAEAEGIFRGLPGTVLVARGNHDRVHNDPQHASCGPDHDCFRTTFYPGRAPGRIYGSTTFRGYHFVMLDSVAGSSTGDLTDAQQNAWLARDLAAHRKQPTFIFFHHPASEYADTFQEEPVIFGVPPQNGGTQFLDTVAANPQIVGVLQAHTHRNFNTYALKAGNRTPFIENGTSKEYPGGYSIFSIYQGGYTRSYFRPRDCPFCREWTETTRQEYFGLAQHYLLGSLGTRNFSHVYDCSAQIPAASLPGEESLLSGGVITPPHSCLKQFADGTAGGRGCLARRAPIGPRNIGRVRLGLTRRALLRRLPAPRRRTKRSWRWCAKGGKGTVAAAFTKKGRVALVATTAPAHGNRRVHPGTRARALRRAYPRRRTLGRSLLRAGPNSPRLLGVRAGRVRYIAVAARRTIAQRRTLKVYLRYAGVARR